TALGRGLGYLPLGSAQSRAAARALLTAQQESDAEDGWDKPLDCTGLAERMEAARERSRQCEERGEALKQWALIYVLPGKENTVRGRLAARINAARARVRQYEAG
ncbi:MAG: hypothetical protein WA869_21385, partial [Alloacidobacterium sp.]